MLGYLHFSLLFVASNPVRPQIVAKPKACQVESPHVVGMSVLGLVVDTASI